VDQNGLTTTMLIGGMALVGLVLAILAFLRARTLARRFSWVTGENAGAADTLPALLRSAENSQREIAGLKSAFEAASIEGRTHFKRLGIVRYNAFDGVAGQQSYTLCLLDENRNGILISNLVGTNFSRGYAVEVKSGQPARPLGAEESQALEAAIKNGN
jgi:hypothetical protein